MEYSKQRVIEILNNIKRKPLEGVGYLMPSERIYNEGLDAAIKYFSKED